MIRRAGTVRAVLAAAVSLMLVPLPSHPAGAVGGEPTLRLLSTQNEATAVRYGDRPARLNTTLFVGADNGPLDLRIRRASFGDPVTLTQVIHGETGTTERALPADLMDGWKGLDNFFRIKVMQPDGRVVWTELRRFCPNSYYRQRLNDSGPDRVTFPDGCFGSPRLLGMTWGIDESWAVSAGGFKLPVPDGTYSVEIAITQTYRDLFGISPADATAQLAVTVKTREDRCDHHCKRPCRRCLEGHDVRASEQDGAAEEGVPEMLDPDESVLPDLRALPSFDINVRNGRSGRSFVEFAATVWVDGASPVVVEGFRRSGEGVMDAYQYFYDNGEVVGRAPAGDFIYDERDGHLHWHILQFVQYQLIDADQANAIRSAKESFCLVPTDAVDLSGDNAARTAEAQDLHTSCGGSEALWIRETLPLGWGDTYYQGGKYGFEITDVPNGTYFVEVEANPDGILYEQDETNNVALREITIKGEPGARRVIVPDPWGIDGRGRW